jgi:hypothetical protein
MLKIQRRGFRVPLFQAVMNCGPWVLKLGKGGIYFFREKIIGQIKKIINKCPFSRWRGHSEFARNPHPRFIRQ